MIRKTLKYVPAIVAFAIVLVVSAGCSGFAFSMGDCGSGDCQLDPYASPLPGASPGYVRILKGDTVRVAACADLYTCAQALNTGNTLARWTLADTAAATFVGSPTSGMVASATSALIRGVAVGRAILTVDFTADGPDYNPTIDIVDSSTVSHIDLISYVEQPNKLQVGGTISFTARLKDASGLMVRAWPTEMSVNDPKIAELRITTDFDGAAKMTLRGLQQGTVALTVKFLGVARSATLTVQP